MVGAALAQDNYTIRPTFQSNLRAEPSLNAKVAELIEPAIPLLVVGEDGDWLVITRFGKTVYMANWIPYSVVGHGEILTIESEFADITCAADTPYQDIGGQRYYSFGGSCEITRISDIDMLPEATAVEVDSETSADAETGGAAEQPDVTPVSPIVEQDFELVGKEAVVEQVKESLMELYAISPNWYDYVADVIDKIVGYEDQPSSPYFNHNASAYVYSSTRTMYVGDYVALQGFGMRELAVGVASVLVHEACHVHQHNKRLDFKYPDREIMCNVVQLKLVEDLHSPEVKGHIEGTIIITLYHNDA